MVKYNLGGKEYELMFTMSGYEMVEDYFGGIGKMQAAMQDESKAVRTCVELLRIMINCGQLAQGKPTLTHDEVASRMIPAQLADLRDVVGKVFTQSMRATTREELDDEVHDEVL